MNFQALQLVQCLKHIAVPQEPFDPLQIFEHTRAQLILICAFADRLRQSLGSLIQYRQWLYLNPQAEHLLDWFHPTRDKNLSLRSATGIISATLNRSNQARSDVTLFNSVRLDFTLTGVSHDEGHQLVDAFKARCPLYGTLAVAAPKVDVNVSTQK